jgi:uncharacterized delta-60 repeat protein
MRMESTKMTRRFTLATASLVLTLLGANAMPDALALPGSLDPSFASGGTCTLQSNIPSQARGPAVDSQGRIVVVRRPASCTTTLYGACGFVTRLRTDGTLDPSFGTGGEYLVDEYPPSSVGLVLGSTLSAPRIAAEDRVLFLQSIVESAPPGRGGGHQMRRLDAAGAADATFTTNGFLDTGGDAPSVFATYGDGRLLLDGSIQLPSPGLSIRRRVLHRYLADGALDGAFAQVEFQQAGNIGWTAGIPLASGGVLLAFFDKLQRYAADGSIDASFGTGGTATVLASPQHEILRLALQPDGKVLVLATVGDRLSLLRVDVDGTPDATYPAQDMPPVGTPTLLF